MRAGDGIGSLRRAIGVLGALIALILPGFAGPIRAAQDSATTPGVPPAGARPAYPKPPPFAKLQYDSMLSVNDQCPVRGGRLNQGIRPVYVNRQPVGFC